MGGAARAVAETPAAVLVVLPELFLGGYVLEGLERLALTPGDSALDPLADAARSAGTAVRPAGATSGPPISPSAVRACTAASEGAIFGKSTLFSYLARRR